VDTSLSPRICSQHFIATPVYTWRECKRCPRQQPAETWEGRRQLFHHSMELAVCSAQQPSPRQGGSTRSVATHFCLKQPMKVMGIVPVASLQVLPQKVGVQSTGRICLVCLHLEQVEAAHLWVDRRQEAGNLVNQVCQVLSSLPYSVTHPTQPYSIHPTLLHPPNLTPSRICGELLPRQSPHQPPQGAALQTSRSAVVPWDHSPLWPFSSEEWEPWKVLEPTTAPPPAMPLLSDNMKNPEC